MKPVQVTTNSANREIRRRMEVIPPVSLHFVSDIALLAPGTSRSVEVEMVASRADSSGILRLEAPDGWKVSPAEQAFHLAAVGERAQFQFTITAPPQSATAKIIAERRNRRSALSQPTRGNQLPAYPAALASAAGRPESH